MATPVRSQGSFGYFIETKATGAQPLRKSTRNTKTPAYQPKTRVTLVAPIFPLPMSLTSDQYLRYARHLTLPEFGEAGHHGWIQFGAPPAMFDLDLAPRRIVEPRPGQLVLFPSYLWHGTLPFDNGDRLTAAFDFLPR